MVIPKKKPTGDVPVIGKKGVANFVPPGSPKQQPLNVVKHDAIDVNTHPATGAPIEAEKANSLTAEVLSGSAGSIFSKMKFVACEGRIFAIIDKHGQPVARPIEDKRVKKQINEIAMQSSGDYKRSDLKGLIEDIKGIAEDHAEQLPVYHRYAPLSSGRVGVEIALHNPTGDRIEVSCTGRRVVEIPSKTAFTDSMITQPLPNPAEQGDIAALNEIVNLDDQQFKLFIGWLMYTMSLPKVEGSKYVFLVINAGQGSGKSFLAKIISKLIDPNTLGIKALPRSERELGLIMAVTHVACFDNARTLSNKQSDRLCQISSGATDITRQLYTDGDLFVTRLHGAIVLNGIHDLITQSDLAQRCMTFHLKKISNSQIRSEGELLKAFDDAHPEIFAYLLDLMVDVFKALPDVKVLRRERQIDFCKWLAACEVAMKLEPGELQNAYANNLKESQLDTLLGNSLAVALIDYVESLSPKAEWQGTPHELLTELVQSSEFSSRNAYDFPANAIALSKRLRGLKASLLTQGFEVEFSRGKERRISITNHNLY